MVQTYSKVYNLLVRDNGAGKTGNHPETGAAQAAHIGFRMARLQISAEMLVGMVIALLTALVLVSMLAGAHAFTLHTYAAIRQLAGASGIAALEG
jgi:hypothetical protein